MNGESVEVPATSPATESPSTSANDAADLLAAKRFTTLPAADADEQLIGVATRRDPHC